MAQVTQYNKSISEELTLLIEQRDHLLSQANLNT